MVTSLPFYKLQATGNDFIFLKEEDVSVAKISMEQIVPQMCQRNLGIGADGLAVIRSTRSNALSWIFYNSDGKEANMCGNAARCAVVFYQKILGGHQDMMLQTRAGLIRGENGQTESMGEREKKISYSLSLEDMRTVKSPMEGAFPIAHFVNTGVPHAVIPVPSPWDMRERASELARYVRADEFGPGGGNLTFVHWDDSKDGHKHNIQAVTLERGVDNFTLSCGTGVMAAVAVHAKLFKHNHAMSVTMPGGTLMAQVDWAKGEVSLEGPAHFVYRGIYEII